MTDEGTSNRFGVSIDTAYAAFLESVGRGRDGEDADTYFLKPGYQSRAEPTYFVDDLDEAVYQPDIYELAAFAARRVNASCLIDVGCGQAKKLMALSEEFETIGIDFGANLQHCQQQYPTRTWIACDLDQSHTLPVPSAVLRRSVIVCSDVIEHLVHPEYLLRSLGDELQQALLGIWSTPERDLTRGLRDMGPPANPCHIREWNLAEFARLLEHYGMPPLRIGLTRTEDKWETTHTMLVFVRGGGR